MGNTCLKFLGNLCCGAKPSYLWLNVSRTLDVSSNRCLSVYCFIIYKNTFLSLCPFRARSVAGLPDSHICPYVFNVVSCWEKSPFIFPVVFPQPDNRCGIGQGPADLGQPVMDNLVQSHHHRTACALYLQKSSLHPDWACSRYRYGNRQLLPVGCFATEIDFEALSLAEDHNLMLRTAQLSKPTLHP